MSMFYHGNTVNWLLCRPKQKKCSWNLDELQRIPDHIGQRLTLETYSAIRCYLSKVILFVLYTHLIHVSMSNDTVR